MAKLISSLSLLMWRDFYLIFDLILLSLIEWNMENGACNRKAWKMESVIEWNMDNGDWKVLLSPKIF